MPSNSLNQYRESLLKQIPKVNKANFEALALAIFQYQVHENTTYREYCSLLNIQTKSIAKLTDIPFLPIQFFKNHEIKSGNWQEATIFKSSGTTGQQQSQHFVRDVDFYNHISTIGFETYYQSVKDYCILALLPSYLERQDSSLVSMCNYFIQQSRYEESGFFLNNYKTLCDKLTYCQKNKIPTLLIGVSFALLDLAEQYPMDLSEITIMETGGMKGRRKEITREELHTQLKTAFNVSAIQSEYGMTELLSQAYAVGVTNKFFPTPSMRVFSRDITDPLKLINHHKTGAINITDLANIDTCSFIATDDIGKVYADNSFSIMGRLDASDIRGCNLMFFK